MSSSNKNTLTVTFADGTTESRTTASAYTHVVVARWGANHPNATAEMVGKWCAITWTTQPAKALRSTQNGLGHLFTEMQVVAL